MSPQPQNAVETKQPTLSAMTDQEIRDEIDELYDRMNNQVFTNEKSHVASVIQVYQNELILRQLEGKDIREEIDKLDGKGLNEKQGLKGLGKAKGIPKGFRAMA